MPRTSSRTGGGTLDKIAEEALGLFYAKGYHATSIRDIATAADVATSTLFHHYASKEDILARIMMQSLAETTERVRQADQSATDAPSRMRAVVTALVLAHTELQRESFVNNAELRSLGPALAKEVVASRRALGETVAAIVAEGVEAGDFHVERPEEAATAIITMVTAVASWFRQSGPRSADDVAHSYADYAMRLLGLQQPAQRRQTRPTDEPTADRTGSTTKSSRSARRVQSQ